jgi:alpha-beta hydrolase superfamily lysophospholipase
LAGCTQVFFQPHRNLIDTPARVGVAYQNEYFQAADGTRLNAWFLPARGEAKGTVLFLHGNAENISTHFYSVVWLPAQGYNVLALDYRGYGASDGVPTLAGVQLDIDAAMRNLLTHQGVDPKRIVLLGQSLGGALAVHYAAHGANRSKLRALVIDSAFSDYRQITREKLAGFALTWPLQWLPWLTVDNDYAPIDSIAALSMPLLFIHGDSDRVIPPHHSRQLFERAREPKELLVVPGAGHIQSLNSPAAREYLVEYLLRNTR